MRALFGGCEKEREEKTLGEETGLQIFLAALPRPTSSTGLFGNEIFCIVLEQGWTMLIWPKLAPLLSLYICIIVYINCRYENMQNLSINIKRKEQNDVNQYTERENK